MTMENGTKTPKSHVSPRIGSNTNTAFTVALHSHEYKNKSSKEIKPLACDSELRNISNT